MTDLRGKTVIITGASSGIGEACAHAFARKGCRVVLAARNLEKLQQVVNSIEQQGGVAFAVACNVKDPDDCKNLIEKTVAKFGSVDILINNAGISMRAMFHDLDFSVLEELMNTNFWGAVYCTRFALPYLLKANGSVVAVNSWAGFTGLPARTGYSASKFALLGFMEALRVENLKKGLHVGSIFPGYTSSNIRNTALNAQGKPQQDSPLNENKLMPADKVAYYVVRMVEKRRKYHVLTLMGKLTYWINKIFPDFIDHQVYKVVSREKNSPFQ